MKVLILLFHPSYAGSHANRALAEAACTVDGVDVVDMTAHYPDLDVDTDTEVNRLFTADRLVLQFPVQWYSTPPLLKTWQDVVLTRMFYIKPNEEGARIRGLPVMVAATAGNDPEAYTPTGPNLFSLEELLRPLQSTAHRCALKWERPFLVYQANKSSPERLREHARDYAARLAAWR